MTIIELTEKKLPESCYIFKNSTACPVSFRAADEVKAHTFDMPLYWIDVIENRGKRYRVEGYVDGKCPTDICGAVCCKVCNLQGRVGEGPCEFLDSDDLCRLHKMNVHCKPVSCLVWPTSQESIDGANKLAERLGFAGRCQLRMVEIE